MPTYTLDPDSITTSELDAIFNMFVAVSEGAGGGTIQMTDLLDIINFPDDVRQRIKNARGPVTVSECSAVTGGQTCKANNTGTKVTEELPGTGGLIGIIIQESFSCSYELTIATQRLKIDQIAGLNIDLPGPLNPGVDTVEIVVPSKVVTITY